MSKQDEEKQELTQEQAQRAVEKLQAFYDSLPQDEKIVLEAVLSMAAGAEVTGHAIPYPQPVYNSISLGYKAISLGSSNLSIFRPSDGAWYVESSADSFPGQGQAGQGGGGGGAAGGASWVGNQFREGV